MTAPKPTVTLDLEQYRKLLIENSRLRREVTRLKGKLRHPNDPRPRNAG